MVYLCVCLWVCLCVCNEEGVLSVYSNPPGVKRPFCETMAPLSANWSVAQKATRLSLLLSPLIVRLVCQNKHPPTSHSLSSHRPRFSDPSKWLPLLSGLFRLPSVHINERKWTEVLLSHSYLFANYCWNITSSKSSPFLSVVTEAPGDITPFVSGS